MMKRKLKFIIPFIIIIIAVIFYFAGNYSSGSLGYAEQYEFSVSNIQLIKAVEKIKSENKEFIPPSYYSEPDSVDAYTPNRFNVYLFYHDQNSVVYFVIDKDHQDINKSTINFVSINEGLTGPLYKRINKDFDRDDNLKIKKEFEERVLKNLDYPYKDKGNGMFVFWK